MRLLQRSIAFLLTVFLVQIVIFSFFWFNLAESQRKVEEARQALAIAQKVTMLHRGLEEWISNFIASVGTNKRKGDDKELQAKARQLTTEFKSIAQDLRVHGKEEDRKLIHQAQRGYTYMKARIDLINGMLERREFDLPILFQVYSEFRLGQAEHLKDSARALTKIVERQQKTADLLRKRDQDWQSKFSLFVLAAFFVNVGGLSIVVVGFINFVLKRIGLLNDNFVRFGKGMPLKPSAPGKDEIASLDEAFRALSLD
ncbi:MAG: hypothetical protein K2Z81_14770, partial [Cyanobacteria bacterium]|nr:hypothetical protein [Cyanobacteriota bacterium]